MGSKFVNAISRRANSTDYVSIATVNGVLHNRVFHMKTYIREITKIKES